LYEQVVFELLECGERELAKELVRTTEPLTHLKESHPDRFLKLEHLCLRPYFNASDAYEMGRYRFILNLVLLTADSESLSISFAARKKSGDLK